MYKNLFSTEKARPFIGLMRITIGILILYFLLIWLNESMLNGQVSWFKIMDLYLTQLFGATFLFTISVIVYFIYVIIAKKKFNLILPSRVFNLYITLGIIKMFTSLLVIFMHPENKAWSTKYEDEYKSGLMKNYGTMFNKDDAPRMIDCIVGKLKREYPNGLNNVPLQELIEFNKETSKECMVELGISEIYWNPLVEKSLLDSLDAILVNDITEKEARENIKNCVLNKLKAKYPEKMPENGFTVSDNELLIECLREYDIIN